MRLMIAPVFMLGAACGPAMAQDASKVDPTPLAEVYEKIGSQGNEKDLFPYFGTELDTKTFQAQFMELRKSGHLVSDDSGETMRLTNWGECK